METATDLTQRLYLGECAAALARYIDESSNTIKPVGTIIYSPVSYTHLTLPTTPYV